MDIPQCGNVKVAMFVSLLFYGNSILADFRWSKTTFLEFLEALNCVLWQNLTLGNVKGSQKIVKASQIVKMVVFLKSAKIDFLQNQISRKMDKYIIHLHQHEVKDAHCPVSALQSFAFVIFHKKHSEAQNGYQSNKQ